MSQKFQVGIFRFKNLSSFSNGRTLCIILHIKICTARSLKQRFYTLKSKDALNMKWNAKLPGATMISCFLDLILRKVKSFWGSMSRTVLLAFIVSWWRRPAYWTVVELSKVVLIGMPVMRFNLGLNFFFDYKSNMHIVEILENTDNCEEAEKVMADITHRQQFYFLLIFHLHMDFKIQLGQNWTTDFTIAFSFV